jgi:HD-GYP domain-containing protein (c-di-GMP phosphodiesterase class II)
MEKVYTGIYTEHDVQHLLTTLQNLTVAARKYQQKKTMIPDVMLKMLEQLKLSDDETIDSLYASLIYDLGLMLFDDNVLSKKNLSQAEIDTIKVHPHTTIGLLNSFEFAEPVKKTILYHHERYDGTGYPARLQGEDIPFSARILAVVDTYCAMISDRPYRKAFTKEEALAEVKKGAGSKYDPYVVATLSTVMNAATA